MFDTVKNITYGIRYVRSFRVPQISGAIIDDILRGNKSPFDEDFFPKTVEDSRGGKTLFSDKHETRLTINRDDIIFSYQIENPEDDYSRLKGIYIPYLVELVTKYEIHRIHRFGTIFRHEIANRHLADKVSSELTHNQVRDPNEFVARISKTMRTLKGEAIRDKNDYRNAIYTFETDENALYVDVDYQYYFEPKMADIRETNPSPLNFLDDARKFIASQYDWLKKFRENHGQK